MTKRAKELEDREPLFKKAAEDLANQFKEKLKKVKDENKKFKEENKKLKDEANIESSGSQKDDLIEVKTERDWLKSELERLQSEQLSAIEQIEASVFHD
jgi:hypothetical protein